MKLLLTSSCNLPQVLASKAMVVAERERLKGVDV